MTYPKKERATKQKDVSQEWGKPAWEYSDGSVRGERGKMLKALTGGQRITPQNRPAYAEARANKVQQAIQAALVAGTPGGKIPGADATAIIAAGAAKLYHEAMQGKDSQQQPVYMRDRIKVWETVGAKAGLLEDKAPVVQARDAALVGLVGLALRLAGGQDAGSVVDAEATEAEE